MARRTAWFRLDRPEDRARWLSLAVLGVVIALSAVLYWLRLERERETARANESERQLVVSSGALARARSGLMATLGAQARDALARDDPRTARANVRAALEDGDDVAIRALWWQLQNDALRWRISVASYAHSVAFSADNSTLAVGGTASTVWLVDAQSGEVRRLRGDDPQVTALTLSPDGTQLAALGS